MTVKKKKCFADSRWLEKISANSSAKPPMIPSGKVLMSGKLDGAT
jgi:hypothetical protein